MTAVPYRFFDTHTHFLQGTPLDRSAEIYKQLFALTNTEKAAFLSLPNSFAEGLGPFQNIEALYFKDFFSPNGYAFAGLIHNFSLDAEAQSLDFLHQVETYFSSGFDALKMLEGKPTMRKATNLKLTDYKFDRTFSFLEENGIPLTIHNADPATFWDLSKMLPSEIENGWYCDPSLPTKDEMFEEVMVIMQRHPRLHLTLAHYGFTSDAIHQAKRFLDGYEYTALDMTPGWEQYTNMHADIENWLPFLESHADRFKYGTDFENYNVSDDDIVNHLRPSNIIRNFMETDTEHTIHGHTYRGINLDSSLLQKMYYENAAKEYGDPKPISKAFIAAEIEKHLPICTEEEKYDLSVVAAHFSL